MPEHHDPPRLVSGFPEPIVSTPADRSLGHRHNHQAAQATSRNRTSAIPPVQTAPTREHVGSDTGTRYQVTAVSDTAGSMALATRPIVPDPARTRSAWQPASSTAKYT